MKKVNDHYINEAAKEKYLDLIEKEKEIIHRLKKNIQSTVDTIKLHEDQLKWYKEKFKKLI